MRDRRDYMREYREKKKTKDMVTATGYEPEQTFEGEAIEKIPASLISARFGVVFPTCLLVLFMFANSGFLVYEQTRFYVLKGWPENYGIFVSVLSEISAIVLSFFASLTRDFWQKIKILTLLFLTVCCILSTIALGISHTASYEEKNAEIAGLMREEISRLHGADASPAKLAKKKTELENFLEKHEIGKNVTRETFVLAFMRVLAVFWNIAFAGFLAGIWKRH